NNTVLTRGGASLERSPAFIGMGEDQFCLVGICMVRSFDKMPPVLGELWEVPTPLYDSIADFERRAGYIAIPTVAHWRHNEEFFRVPALAFMVAGFCGDSKLKGITYSEVAGMRVQSFKGSTP
ncbi:MAG TPA: hypothetical protein VD994_11520, partial [Prosthecobacter sp.]|nr:hypothetical protein [Prosthecobacter sp.]